SEDEGPSDARTAAFALTAISLADAGAPSRAVELLERALTSKIDDLHRAFVLTHLAVRAAESGDAATAVSSATSVLMLEFKAPGRLRDAIVAVNRRNLIVFRQQ